MNLDKAGRKMKIVVEEYAEAILTVVIAVPIIAVFMEVLHIVSAF